MLKIQLRIKTLSINKIKYGILENASRRIEVVVQQDKWTIATSSLRFMRTETYRKLMGRRPSKLCTLGVSCKSISP